MKTFAKQIKITESMVRTFAQVVGDRNPVHLDESVAAKTRFKKRIAHGMVAVSFIHSMMPQNSYWSNMQVKFKKPVFFDQVVKIELQLQENGGEAKAIISKQTSEGEKKGQKQIVTEVTGKWQIIQ